jgi:ureidoglycolate lyase
MSLLKVEPLTAEAFTPFGDVVEDAGIVPITINEGFATRLNTSATLDVAREGGRVQVAIFEAKPRSLPLEIRMMERHPLGSQLFYPLQAQEWLVVVCAEPNAPQSYRAFRASGRQGVNYTANTWHHPLLVLSGSERFLVIDRAGPGQNLEEVWLEPAHVLRLGLQGPVNPSGV